MNDALSAGFESVINLGAGLDTRAFRTPGIENVKYYELDLPELLRAKRAYIDKNIAGLPSNLSLIPIDFDSQVLSEELKKAGYNLSSKTLFI